MKSIRLLRASESISCVLSLKKDILTWEVLLENLLGTSKRIKLYHTHKLALKRSDSESETKTVPAHAIMDYHSLCTHKLRSFSMEAMTSQQSIN